MTELMIQKHKQEKALCTAQRPLMFHGSKGGGRVLFFFNRRILLHRRTPRLWGVGGTWPSPDHVSLPLPHPAPPQSRLLQPVLHKCLVPTASPPLKSLVTQLTRSPSAKANFFLFLFFLFFSSLLPFSEPLPFVLLPTVHQTLKNMKLEFPQLPPQTPSYLLICPERLVGTPVASYPHPPGWHQPSAPGKPSEQLRTKRPHHNWFPRAISCDVYVQQEHENNTRVSLSPGFHTTDCPNLEAATLETKMNSPLPVFSHAPATRLLNWSALSKWHSFPSHASPGPSPLNQKPDPLALAVIYIILSDTLTMTVSKQLFKKFSKRFWLGGGA